MERKTVRILCLFALAALLLCCAAGTAALAAGNLVLDPAEQTAEAAPSAAPFVLQGAGSRVADTVFWAGAFLAAGGTLGIVIMAVMTRVVAAHSDSDDREEVLGEIEEARQLAKQREAAARRERDRRSRRAVDSKADTDELPAVRSTDRGMPGGMTLEDFLAEPMSAEEKRAARPKRPPAPPRRDPAMEDVYSSYRPRHEAASGTAPKTRPAKRPAPAPKAAEAPAEEAAAVAAAETPVNFAAEPAAVPHKTYDVDEILREVRERRL